MAALRGAPGGATVEHVLARSAIGAVNPSEVLAKLAERGVPDEAIRTAVGGLGLRVVAFDEETAPVAASLRRVTRRRGRSFGDRACPALGRKPGLPVITADRGWAGLDAGVEIRLIR